MYTIIITSEQLYIGFIIQCIKLSAEYSRQWTFNGKMIRSLDNRHILE